MADHDSQAGDPAALSDEADQILRALRGIVRSITINSKRLFRETGMTLPQILCLRAIDAASQRERFVTAAEVARHVQLSPATVTGIIDRLERSQLLTRERDTADRRKIYLRITAKGQEWLNSLPPSLQDRAVERLNSLHPERRRGILGALREVLEIMEASNLDTSPILTADEDPKIARSDDVIGIDVDI